MRVIYGLIQYWANMSLPKKVLIADIFIAGVTFVEAVNIGVKIASVIIAAFVGYWAYRAHKATEKDKLKSAEFHDQRAEEQRLKNLLLEKELKNGKDAKE